MDILVKYCLLVYFYTLICFMVYKSVLSLHCQSQHLSTDFQIYKRNLKNQFWGTSLKGTWRIFTFLFSHIL